MKLEKKSAQRQRRVRLNDFTCIQEPHPYGCLPGGNRFFGSVMSDKKGKNSELAKQRPEDILDDKLWQQVLSFCDAQSLRSLIQTSRHFYVTGHQPELWRDQVLRKCEAEELIISKVGPTWKDTYDLMFESNTRSLSSTRHHRPMRMPDVFSDEIFRSHLCRSFTIPPPWLEETLIRSPTDNRTMDITKAKCQREVEIVNVEDMTALKFFSEFEECNQPVVVKGAANGKAVDNWGNWNYLTERNSKSSYRSTSGTAPLPGNFTLEAYRDYIESTTYLEESPLYLFDRTAFARNEHWVDDFFPDFYRKCPYWDPSGVHGHDMLQHLGKDQRPDHTWVIMGPKRSGSVFHIDPNATHAWNACIRGRKRWIFYPPGKPPPGVFPSVDGDEVALPLSVGEWIVQYWKEHCEQYRERPEDQRPMECTTHPGDVIFVPHGWWHSVINLDDANIAITHNYISPSNLGNALKFFSEKQEQISGCRDRNESIKPEHIHDELVKVLKLKEPQHLKRATQQAGWTCRAWEGSKPKVINDNSNNVSASMNKRRKFGDIKLNQQHVSKKNYEGNKQLSKMFERVPEVSFSFSFL